MLYEHDLCKTGDNLSKMLPLDIKNKRRGVSVYVCFSRMLEILVQTLNEMKLFKVNHLSHLLINCNGLIFFFLHALVSCMHLSIS